MGIKGLGAAMALMMVMVASQAVHADEAPAGTSTATSRSMLDQLSDHYALTYWGNFNGPSVGNHDNYNPGPDGTDANGAPQYLDSILTASYKLNPNLLLGVAQEFYYRPVISQDMTLLDPAVRLQAYHVLHNDNWDLKLEGWAYAPVTAKSRAANEATMLKVVENLNYSVGNLTVGLYGYAEQQFYTADSTTVTPNDRKLYLAPNGSYAIGKRTQVTCWVDWIQSLHARGDAGLIMPNYPWDVEPGVNFDITPQLSVNPYINVFPGNPTLASTYIGLILVGKAI